MSDTCPYCEPFTTWGAHPEVFESMKKWHDEGHPVSKEAAVTKKLPAVLHENERPVVEDSIADDADEWLEKILRILSDEHASTYLVNQAKAAINRLYIKRSEANKRVASDIFNLAHEYASEDETMRGSEELRAYHYYNAIHKIGEFDDR
jgi:hypothetical protein